MITPGQANELCNRPGSKVFVTGGPLMGEWLKMKEWGWENIETGKVESSCRIFMVPEAVEVVPSNTAPERVKEVAKTVAAAWRNHDKAGKPIMINYEVIQETIRKTLRAFRYGDCTADAALYLIDETLAAFTGHGHELSQS